MEEVSYKVSSDETTYYRISLFISVVVYVCLGLGLLALIQVDNGLFALIAIMPYIIMIALWIIVRAGLFVGHIRGNGVKITKNQFPDIYAIIEKQCEKLRMDIPSAYILQSGGMLNAFATKFLGRNYVVLYSEILELAYEQGQDALEFIIAHELGHVKRKHMTKSLLLFPSKFIIFLPLAYSRGCEYTCDNIGNALSPNGATDGLLILAAGKDIYKKVNADEYINEEENDRSFWKTLAEMLSSHPNLPKRIRNLKNPMI